MPPSLAESSTSATKHRRRVDLALGIVVGLILGVGVCAAFLFLGSEGAIDAPRISGVDSGKPAQEAKAHEAPVREGP